MKTFKSVVRNMDMAGNDMNGMSFKDCLNVSSARITDIETGRIVGNVSDDDLHDQIQFGLIFSWPKSSRWDKRSSLCVT